jgi:hypothetical protein
MQSAIDISVWVLFSYYGALHNMSLNGKDRIEFRLKKRRIRGAFRLNISSIVLEHA